VAKDKDMFESDSGKHNVHRYEKKVSREFTAEELAEFERKARKEGKRDIILSQLVEQQAETATTMKNIQTRLTEGDRDIKRLNDEHAATLASLNKVADQANKATSSFKEHIAQCDERWKVVEKTINDANKNITARIANNKQMNPILQTTLSNLISALVIAAVMGGLMAYFSGNSRDKNKDSDKEKPTITVPKD